MKSKTTRIWVVLANEAQKIEKAVYRFTSGWKKDLMVIRRYALKPKSLQGGLE